MRFRSIAVLILLALCGVFGGRVALVNRESRGPTTRIPEAHARSGPSESDSGQTGATLVLPVQSKPSPPPKLDVTREKDAIRQAAAKVARVPFTIAARPAGDLTDPVRDLQLPLRARRAHPAKNLVLPPGEEHRLTVKFVDDALARLSGPTQLSLSVERIPDALQRLVQTHLLAFEPIFSDPADIDALRVRAAQRSLEMQADLNGTMMVRNVPLGRLLEIAQAFQSLALVESVDLESTDRPPPPPGDISPPTPDLNYLQGYHDTDPGFGITFAHNLGITGAGVRVSDCEYGYNPDHEDLDEANLTNDSRAPINSSVYTNGWDEHGTAVTGMLVAGDNGFGVLGMVPDCNLHFYSEWTTLGYSRTNAISDAIMDSAAGDIILLEMQRNDGNGYGPAELNSTVWNLTKTATDAGIIVVGAAGNGNLDLDSATNSYYIDRGDSGAILVGAGSNSTSHTKRSTSTYGARVDVQAWGTGVATTGYGAYASYGGDGDQSYTASFNGTSSASACVAGVVAAIQSYARNTLRTNFTPAEMRTFLKNHGHPQTGSGGNIGPCVALDLALPALPEVALSAEVEAVNSSDLELNFWGLPFRSYAVMVSGDLSSWDPVQTGVAGGPDAITIPLPGEGPAHHNRRYFQVLEE